MQHIQPGIHKPLSDGLYLLHVGCNLPYITPPPYIKRIPPNPRQRSNCCTSLPTNPNSPPIPRLGSAGDPMGVGRWSPHRGLHPDGSRLQPPPTSSTAIHDHPHPPGYVYYIRDILYPTPFPPIPHKGRCGMGPLF
jgi:hypothetical protein